MVPWSWSSAEGRPPKNKIGIDNKTTWSRWFGFFLWKVKVGTKEMTSRVRIRFNHLDTLHTSTQFASWHASHNIYSLGSAPKIFQCIENKHHILLWLSIQRWSTLLPLSSSYAHHALLLAHSLTHEVSSMFLPDDSHRCLRTRIPLLRCYCTCNKRMAKTSQWRTTLLRVRPKIHPRTCPTIFCLHRWVNRRELYSWIDTTRASQLIAHICILFRCTE